MITIKNEELSPEKQAYIILDKLAQDLKKIYDEEDYEIYEEERLDKASEDLTKLKASQPMIKEMISYVSKAVYSRMYNQDALRDKINEIVSKYTK